MHCIDLNLKADQSSPFLLNLPLLHTRHLGFPVWMSLLLLLTCQRCVKTKLQVYRDLRSREDIATCVRIPGLQPTAATSPHPTSPRASTTIVQAIQSRQLFQKMFHIYFWTVFWKKESLHHFQIFAMLRSEENGVCQHLTKKSSRAMM